MRGLLASVVFASSLASSAAAQHVVHNVDWLHKPTQADLIAVYPREAYQKGLGGTATLSCVVTVQGALRDCAVTAETPAGAGFGRAAIALTPQFHFRPTTVDGVPEEAEINIPIRFHRGDPVDLRTPPTRTGSRVPTKRDIAVNLTQVSWSEAPTLSPAEVPAIHWARSVRVAMRDHAHATDLDGRGRV